VTPDPDGRGGRRARWASRSSAADPVNGVAPVSSSWRITPAAYTSVRASGTPPRSHCSGAMYAGVPSKSRSHSGGGSDPPRARPRSTRRAGPDGGRKTFSGLRSQWAHPQRCSASTGARTARRIRTASSPGNGAARASSRSASRGSSIRSSASQRVPSSRRPEACSSGTAGGPRIRSATASRARRAGAPGTSALATFRATGRPSSTAVAASTAASPPIAIVLSIR